MCMAVIVLGVLAATYASWAGFDLAPYVSRVISYGSGHYAAFWMWFTQVFAG